MKSRLRKRIEFGTAGKVHCVLYACIRVNREDRPSGKNGSGVFAYERPHGYPSFSGWRVLSLADDTIEVPLSQGLCAYVLKTVDQATHRGVVVGHDHRHHSEHWAALTAAAFLSKGMKVYLLHGLVHTPLYVPRNPFPHLRC